MLEPVVIDGFNFHEFTTKHDLDGWLRQCRKKRQRNRSARLRQHSFSPDEIVVKSATSISPVQKLRKKSEKKKKKKSHKSPTKHQRVKDDFSIDDEDLLSEEYPNTKSAITSARAEKRKPSFVKKTKARRISSHNGVDKIKTEHTMPSQQAALDDDAIVVSSGGSDAESNSTSKPRHRSIRTQHRRARAAGRNRLHHNPSTYIRKQNQVTIARFIFACQQAHSGHIHRQRIYYHMPNRNTQDVPQLLTPAQVQQMQFSNPYQPYLPHQPYFHQGFSHLAMHQMPPDHLQAAHSTPAPTIGYSHHMHGMNMISEPGAIARHGHPTMPSIPVTNVNMYSYLTHPHNMTNA